jgi:hypothetical protein
MSEPVYDKAVKQPRVGDTLMTSRYGLVTVTAVHHHGRDLNVTDRLDRGWCVQRAAHGYWSRYHVPAEYEPVGRMPLIGFLQPGEVQTIPEHACCDNCGTSKGDRSAWSIVVDWRVDALCPSCVAAYDWADWHHVGNVYQHR